VQLLALALVSLATTTPPAWIQRAAIPGPIVAWRTADLLGTPPAEGIAVSRDPVSHTMTVNVVDSRFDPPRVVKLHELPGTRVRWLRAGARDGLARDRIAIDVVGAQGETAYVLRIGRGLSLPVVRAVRGSGLAPKAVV
jgi:hypothetical protein